MRKLLLISISLLIAGGVVGEEDGNTVEFLPYDKNNPECLIYGLSLDTNSRTISNEPKALSQLMK